MCGGDCCSQSNPQTCFQSSAGSGSAATSSGGQAAASSVTQPPPCSTALFLLEYCSSLTPNFASQATSAQAACLCYSSTAWSPNGFDSPYSSCVAYYASAAPTDTSDLAVLSSSLGFCAQAGNVESAQSTVGGAPMTMTGGSTGTQSVASESSAQSGATAKTSGAMATSAMTSGSTSSSTSASASASTSHSTISSASASASPSVAKSDSRMSHVISLGMSGLLALCFVGVIVAM